MKRAVTIAAALVLALSFGVRAQTSEQNEAKTLDELVDMIREGTLEDRQEYDQRIQEFRQARNEQAALLEKARNRRDALEERSAELEEQFNTNEETIARKEETLNERLGALRELFGVFQQVAGDARSVFKASPVSVQYPGRGEFLKEFAQKMGRASQIASIEEIRKLWFELQREMTESGKIVKFPAEVTRADGTTTEREIVRVGVFNVVSEGEYLQYSPDTGRLTVLPRQPADRYVDYAWDFQQAEAGLTDFGLDPSRGSILSLLIQTPGLWERIQQGGFIGYVILALAAVALGLTAERMWVLVREDRKVQDQMKSREARQDNSLGRVLKAYEDHPKDDPEALERHLGEAILKEIPPLNRFLNGIRLIAAVAPLLGLLGTVTGMINTFQAITLFGTGDPKLMAGGISQALVTTMMGLSVAIPTLLLHSAVASRSRRIVQILEEQSAGLVAQKAESTAQTEARA